jgi:hypothetical protein
VSKPFILTPRIEEILRTVHFYRYMTALDVTHLIFSPGSLTHVRDILKVLCGGQDYASDQYLYRFPLTQFSSGKTEKIFTLGSRGRDFLANDLGLPVDWYFRPTHIKHLSHGLIVHNLTLTRFLVAARVWCRSRPGIVIPKLHISYEMERAPGKVEVIRDGKRVSVKVIPDAWILFENTKAQLRSPVLLEIDRGREYKDAFKEHVRSRIEFIKSGAYGQMFEGKGCVIAYATTGELPEYRESRLTAMCGWTMDVLSEMQIKDWASILRFGAVVRKTMFETPLFMGRMWRRPDSESPVRLLGD